jgi:ATP-dependent DNA helicase RecG
MARLSDVGLLELARSEAISLYKSDPDLKNPVNSLLAYELKRVWQNMVSAGS